MGELPEFCFVFRDGQLPGHKIAKVRRDETGFWPVRGLPDATDGEALDSIRRANEALAVDGVHAFCMKNGSLFGFHTKGSDPQWVREHNWRVDANDRSGEGRRDVC
jgi:hypothetical protein